MSGRGFGNNAGCKNLGLHPSFDGFDMFEYMKEEKNGNKRKRRTAGNDRERIQLVVVKNWNAFFF